MIVEPNISQNWITWNGIEKVLRIFSFILLQTYWKANYYRGIMYKKNDVVVRIGFADFKKITMQYSPRLRMEI